MQLSPLEMKTMTWRQPETIIQTTRVDQHLTELITEQCEGGGVEEEVWINNKY